MIYDATACPQDIAYPTDIGLLNKSREITEAIIDELHAKNPQGKKPRTYRKVARKRYLKVAQNKNPSRKTIRKGIKSQLQYLRRNFKTIEKQLDGFSVFPLAHRLQRKYWVIQTVYDQQQTMFKAGTHQVEDRIVSITQPHIRPIVRGKARAKTEFGAKIHLSLVDGFSFLDTISWDAFNEGSHLKEYVEKTENALVSTLQKYWQTRSTAPERTGSGLQTTGSNWRPNLWDAHRLRQWQTT